MFPDGETLQSVARILASGVVQFGIWLSSAIVISKVIDVLFRARGGYVPTRMSRWSARRDDRRNRR